MSIQAEKIQLVKMLLDTENPKIIESIKELFKKEAPADFWNNLSLKDRTEIEKASAEIENGQVTDYETFMQKHR
ncbi:MAG: hypothetical protein K9G46_12920 [Flavobacteriales bacterium]|jgi:hypothetical protein|nr:hypothetical protein [Flavobacteriales bacterium]